MWIGVGTGGEAVTCEDVDDTWWESGFGEEGAETGAVRGLGSEGLRTMMLLTESAKTWGLRIYLSDVREDGYMLLMREVLWYDLADNTDGFLGPLTKHILPKSSNVNNPSVYDGATVSIVFRYSHILGGCDMMTLILKKRTYVNFCDSMLGSLRSCKINSTVIWFCAIRSASILILTREAHT